MSSVIEGKKGVGTAMRYASADSATSEAFKYPSDTAYLLMHLNQAQQCEFYHY